MHIIPLSDHPLAAQAANSCPANCRSSFDIAGPLLSMVAVHQTNLFLDPLMFHEGTALSCTWKKNSSCWDLLEVLSVLDICVLSICCAGILVQRKFLPTFVEAPIYRCIKFFLYLMLWGVQECILGYS